MMKRWSTSHAREAALRLDALKETHSMSTSRSFSAPRLFPKGKTKRVVRHHTLLVAVGVSATSVVIALPFIPPVMLLPIGAAGFIIALRGIRSSRERRALAIAEELPSLLSAAATSLRSGATPIGALERGALLLPPGSELQSEVAKLLSMFHQGVSRDEAIESFCSSHTFPDLELFRSALRLTSEHGGRFSSTLEHIAESCRDRCALIQSARVTTTIMNMTANIVLLVAPPLLLLLSAQQPHFWDTLQHNQTASTIGACGLSMILLGYGTLKWMSDFKP